MYLHRRNVPWADRIHSGLFCNAFAPPERAKQSIARFVRVYCILLKMSRF